MVVVKVGECLVGLEVNVIKVRGVCVCVELRFSRRSLGRCDESKVLR